MLLKDNYTEVLEGLLGEGDFFLNLSVDTGSCDLMSYVQRTCVPACLCACLSVCVWRCLPAYLSRCLAQALVARCRAYGCDYDCALALPNSTIDMGGGVRVRICCQTAARCADLYLRSPLKCANARLCVHVPCIFGSGTATPKAACTWTLWSSLGLAATLTARRPNDPTTPSVRKCSSCGPSSAQTLSLQSPRTVGTANDVFET